eukprot:CAMPEP_0196668370 /NCGR_PEP_ID=MMETSP1086-20130531/65587_1 /TAXON_ID=77921 /ORGANISM="Cyanoptyche  gloeocystis , Strain SAG4.97" /LENGTH=31 /DNA_ID= /DNA_START= /DNA_END= /DNA_ORIENTATION=
MYMHAAKNEDQSSTAYSGGAVLRRSSRKANN